MPPGGPWNVTPSADCAKMRLVIWRRICYNRSGHFGRRGPSGSPQGRRPPPLCPQNSPRVGPSPSPFFYGIGAAHPAVYRRPQDRGAGTPPSRNGGDTPLRPPPPHSRGEGTSPSRTTGGTPLQPYSQSKDAACHGKASAWPAGCPGQATVQKKKGRSKKRWTSTTRPG